MRDVRSGAQRSQDASVSERMEPTALAASDVEWSQYSILIVDDNPTNLRVLLDSLERHGFDILVARDGESAIQRAIRVQPDMILLDIVMPGTDGFTTCLRLKEDERTSDIPVIFMTALASSDNKVKGFEVGAVDYITKPLQYDEVLARVTTHLRIRDLQRRLQAQNRLLQQKNAQLHSEIAERARIERRLHHVNQQLRESNISKDMLFSIIAHDLRAPFSALLGLSETVIHYIDDYSKEDLRDNMLKIHASSEAVYGLLENLLAWSRLQRGLLRYRPETIALAALADDLRALFLSQAEHKAVTLTHDIPEGVTVYADKSMLETILRNLLSNAIKFTGPGGSVTVSAIPRESVVEIAVIDTGVGVSDEDIPRLFRVDTQYTQVGTQGEHGTGLGLNLCRELVEHHQGTIWVDSRQGHGSAFRFTLPINQEHAA